MGLTSPGPLGSVGPVASVLVPYLPDSGCRDAAWSFLRAKWADSFPSWQVVRGSSPAGPWVKATAVADALAGPTGDIFVVADADVWTDGVGPAVEAVLGGAPWAVPHRLVRRLDRESTDRVLAGSLFGGSLDQRPYVGMVGGGMVVLRRGVYESCPLDPRFVGWGQEDQSWGIALTALFGPPWRGDADLWHLWHPPQERMTRSFGSLSGRALAVRYRAASGSRTAMVVLLGEINASTRENTVWTYRNVNTGQEATLPRPNARLDALPNWVLTAQPPSPTLEAVVTNPVPEAASVTMERSMGRLRGPDADGAGESTGPIPDPGPSGMGTSTPKPPATAPKSEWIAYATLHGVEGAPSMTRVALIAACG